MKKETLSGVNTDDEETTSELGTNEGVRQMTIVIEV